MAWAWKAGNDPYRLYNSLDDAYRPLTHRHPCPACAAIKVARASWAVEVEPCHLCRDRGYVEIPLAQPGDPLLPIHPDRVRLFVYGAARALAEIEAGRTR